MIKNRSILMLKSLSVEEFRWLHKFIKSPYYNVNPHLIKLNTLLKKYYPDFNHPKLSLELLFSKLYPKESYDVKRMRFLFHHFANLIESFLVAQELKNNDFLFKKTLTKSLGKVNRYDFFKKKTKELLDDLETSPIRDQAFYKNKLELNLQFYSHPATNRQKGGTENLLAAMESLDDYFELSKVKLACALRAIQQTISSEDFEIKFLDTVVQGFDRTNLLPSIYKKILDLQESNNSVDVFGELKNMFASNMNNIRLNDRKNILQFLLNYCTRLVNKGDSGFTKYSLELYKIGLEFNCLLVNDELSEASFINIVSVGIDCKEFEWTKSFIEEYGGFLNRTIRMDAITYSNAIWYFYKNEYDETIKLISNYNFTKPLQILGTKTILIRTYINLFLEDDTYYDLSLAQIINFSRYIRNNKIVSERAAVGYLNFARHTKKFIQLKYQNKSLIELKKKIETSDNLILKKWLLEKI